MVRLCFFAYFYRNTNEIAIYNLLQHPLLIPREIAMKALAKGLKGTGGHPAYRVAAAAGYQRIPKAWIPDNEWEVVGSNLIYAACERSSADAPWPLSIASFQASLRSEMVRNTLPLILTPLWCCAEASEDIATYVFVCSWKVHDEKSFREMIEQCIPEKNDSINGMINVLVKQFVSFKEAKLEGYKVHEGPSTTHIPDYYELQLQKKYSNCSPSMVAALIATFDALDGDDDGFLTGKEYNEFVAKDSEREAGDGLQRKKIDDSVAKCDRLPEDLKISVEEFFERRIKAMLDAKDKQQFKPMTCTLKEKDK